jgi:hypothetical protein
MQRMAPTTSARAALIAATILAVVSAAVLAQPPAQNTSAAQPAAPQGQRPDAPAAGGAAPAPPKTAMPAAASSIAAKPESFYGQYVTVYATVEKALSPTVFSVDQDKSKTTGQEVIVVALRLHEPVEINSYVTVLGEVIKPDAAEITKRAKTGANGIGEILAQHPNRPVIIASAVINGAFTDLAKFIPPPLTAEEAVLDKAMKAVGGANGALRKGIDASNAELVKTNTAILAKAFAETEAFWKTRGNNEAVKFAQTARQATAAIEVAAGQGNWNEAKTQVTTLGQQCTACHVNRERLEDGSFAIKRKDSGQ